MMDMEVIMMQMLSRRRRRRSYHLRLYLHFLWCVFLCISNSWFCNGQETTTVDIGVIMDMDTYVGRTSKTSMELAVEDLAAAHNTVKLILHTRDSKGDPVEAAAAAIDLLKNYQVKAILAGLQQPREIEFVAEIGMKTQVPILSFTPTAGSSSYSIRMAQSDTSELRAIASISGHFNWTQVVPIYVYDDDAILLFLSDELAKVGVAVPYRCRISESATDDQILMHLYKLMTMQTRVFLVHNMPYSMASRLFLLAKKVGMMTKGYAWIISNNLLEDDVNTTKYYYDSMEGVIGVKPYIPNTDHQLDRFSKRWKDKFLQENPGDDYRNVSAFGLWAYDCVSLLAKAIEQITSSSSINSNFTKYQNSNNSLTDIQMIGVFKSGPQLLKSIQSTRFKGISGDINFKNGELPISPFQVINVVGNESRQIGIWTPAGAVKLEKQVIWPGKSIEIPRGWETPVSGKKLKVGVPVKSGFEQFISVKRDTSTNAIVVQGFCKDVFDAVMAELPFSAPYEYQEFEKPEGSGVSAGSYDDLVHAIDSREYEYDVVVGDITITGNRSSYADFTLAYTESGVSMIVPVKGDDRKNAWIFTKPLTTELWITTGVFFVYTGVVIWILEHRVNKAFQDPPPAKQAGLIMWFSFSTLVFAYTEKVVSNLSRFVLIVWVFVVMVLTSSYTASLTSFLTVQQLQPTVTDISDIIRNGDKIGYQEGSFVPDMLKSLYDVDESKLQVLVTPQDYNDALSNGTVAAIVDELPYLRVVLGKYCSKFKMVGSTYKTAGFGFAFPRGSPLVPEVSRAILKVMESTKMNDITNIWFPNTTCSSTSATDNVTSNSLKVESFMGLFLIAGISSALALLIFLIKFLHQNRDILTSQDLTLYQKLVTLAKTFYAPVIIADDQNNGNDIDDHTTTIEMASISDAQLTSSPDQEAPSEGGPSSAEAPPVWRILTWPRDGGRSFREAPPVSPNHSYSIIR